jgi:hypothetical protein
MISVTFFFMDNSRTMTKRISAIPRVGESILNVGRTHRVVYRVRDVQYPFLEWGPGTHPVIMLAEESRTDLT